MPTVRPYDLLIVGGGINGTGIARDAAGRGLSVLLIEQGDLASATSSASSKLAHGGLRYLETFEFRLVAEALAERETLLDIAPHIAWPLTFVLPHDPALRPAWKVRLGLLLYDRLARRSRLHGSRSLRPAFDLANNPLSSRFERAFAYADGWLDNSRLVVLNAVDAREHGATISTRCRFLGARPCGTMWEARIERAGGAVETIAARAVVNAAGPWADTVLASIIDRPGQPRLRLVRGSHIVTRRLHDGPEGFILQNTDGRIVFVLPFEDDFSLIGTTDVEHRDPASVAITEQEADYLCSVVSRSFARQLGRADIVWSYAGVRALVDDGAADPAKVTRDYQLELEYSAPGGPAVLTVYGGKLTTYRRLAERAMEKLTPFFPACGAPWTAGKPLPGGDIAGGDTAAFLSAFCRRNPDIAVPVARRLVRSYGTRADRIAKSARECHGASEDFGIGLSRAELSYLIEEEFARTADDVLWRRTKLGLRATPEQRALLEAAIAKMGTAPISPARE